MTPASCASLIALLTLALSACAEGVTAIYPASLIVGLATGTESTKYQVATGEYNKKIDARIAEIKQTESVRAKQQARTTEQAQEIARTLTTTILTIPVLAGAGDRLYGSVTPADIADEIWRARKIRVDRRKVQLDEPIRRLGTYQVDIEVFPEVIATVKTMVVPAEGSTFDLPVPED